MSSIILFNKPLNVLSQFTDKEGRSTLADYIDVRQVYPAGRLDYDSEGLMVLTDDGELQHQISHPKAKLSKSYWVQVEGCPTKHDLLPLTQGITLKDGTCKPAKVSIIEEPAIWERNPPIRQRSSVPTSWLKITLSEGRNRQVRRMTAAIGFPTLRLIRAQIGNWILGDLGPGEYRTETVHRPATPAKVDQRSKNPSSGRTGKRRR